MNTQLNPYDTGERLEPIPWIFRDHLSRHLLGSSEVPTAVADALGKVDFDNDEGATLVTAWVSRNDDGTYTFHVDNYDEELIEFEGV